MFLTWSFLVHCLDDVNFLRDVDVNILHSKSSSVILISKNLFLRHLQSHPTIFPTFRRNVRHPTSAGLQVRYFVSPGRWTSGMRGLLQLNDLPKLYRVAYVLVCLEVDTFGTGITDGTVGAAYG